MKLSKIFSVSKNSKRNVVDIKKEEGIYTIIYGVHIKEQDPFDIPNDSKFLILETGVMDYLDNPVKTLHYLKNHPQYKAILDYAERKNLTVIFGDLKYVNNILLLLFENAYSAFITLAGTRLIKNKSGKNSFIKRIIGLWLVLPFLVNTLRIISVLTRAAENETSFLKKLTHRIHPEAELFYLSVRNAIFAEKEFMLMHKLQDKKHLTTIIGAGHVGIEDMISLGQRQRLDYLKKHLFFLKKIIKDKYFYTLVTLKFIDGKWQIKDIIEVESLKNLWEKKQN